MICGFCDEECETLSTCLTCGIAYGPCCKAIDQDDLCVECEEFEDDEEAEEDDEGDEPDEVKDRLDDDIDRDEKGMHNETRDE